MKLTEQQAKLLKFIGETTEEIGEFPSLALMAKEQGCSHVSVRRRVVALQLKGLICKRPRCSRYNSLYLTLEGWLALGGWST